MSAGINAAINGTALDVTALGTGMIEAARNAVTEGGPSLQATAEVELRRLAGTLADIGAMFARGELDPERARALVSIHRFSVRSVLRSVEGIALHSVDHAMDAVVLAAAPTINRIAGIKLL